MLNRLNKSEVLDPNSKLILVIIDARFDNGVGIIWNISKSIMTTLLWYEEKIYKLKHEGIKIDFLENKKAVVIFTEYIVLQ